MNSFTHLKLIKQTGRGFFYALYCEGEEYSEFGAFLREYGNHPEFEFIRAIIKQLHRRVIGESNMNEYPFFRPEGALIAIPGKDDNDGIVAGSEIGLRLFCFMPNNKTLVYLNGYHHNGITCDYNVHPNYAHKARRITQAVNGIKKAESLGYIKLAPTGGYYEDDALRILIRNKEEFNLTEYL
ncbi:MAG: hypothetical protein Q8916_06885 [Bacteroidota bacterium]|nr:hypothetical protein [Bacteroidota bacterium]MDP4237098.1 hypothetical protein [Bacteroidota bacterium]